nr:hypothetical protein [Micromonospora sp. DSM 115978]
CEARGRSAATGTLTEFGAVHYRSRDTFHGRLFEGAPDPANPVIPLVGRPVAPPGEVATAFAAWLRERVGSARPVFVSDNPAYDFQWIAALFNMTPRKARTPALIIRMPVRVVAC